VVLEAKIVTADAVSTRSRTSRSDRVAAGKALQENILRKKGRTELRNEQHLGKP
jgi:hypothetical protein